MHALTPFNRFRGFTLIELIIVMVLLGTLAVFAVSRFQGSDGFSSYTYQARALSALRYMQQRAMQDTRDGYCFRINVIPSSAGSPAFGPPSLDYSTGNQAATCGTGIDFSVDSALRTDAGEIASDDVSLILRIDGSNISAAAPIGFNGLGQPVQGNTRICASGCELDFAGEAAVCIASEGYIYAC